MYVLFYHTYKLVSGNYFSAYNRTNTVMIDFNKIWVDFECPKCNYSDEIQLIDAKTEKTIFCHNCKVCITLKDENASVHSSIDSMNSALSDLEKMLKNFGK